MDRQMQQSGKGMVRRLAVLLGSAALLLPLAEPVGQRSGIVARTLLAMAATAMATPAQAQTEITLVSNSGQASRPGGFANNSAQAFTTGGNASGYTLTSITFPTANQSASNGNTATLHSGSRDGTKVADFTATVSGSTFVLTPTTTTTLAKETTYYLVTGNDFGNGTWSITDSDNEDSGAADGWSIANGSEYFSSSMVWTTETSSYRITVKGYANPNVTVANEIEDQSAVVGTAFSFTFSDDTFNNAGDGTLTYTAMLAGGGTLPPWLTFTPASRSFSGTPGASDGGAITVRVTASNGTDDVHDDFEIKVGTTCAAPNLGTRRQLWTNTITVGPSDGAYGWGDEEIFGSLVNVTPGTNQTFTIGATSRRLVEISVEDGALTLLTRNNGRLPPGVQLHICDTALDIDNDSYRVQGNSNYHGYRWNLGWDWSGETTRTVALSLPANSAATGAPTVTSSFDAVVGDVLTADTSTIVDANGLPSSFTYQWVREDTDGTNAADISGATSSTYTLVAADVGKKVRIKVSFTDLHGSEEMRQSAPWPGTGSVMEASASCPVPDLTGRRRIWSAEVTPEQTGTSANTWGYTNFPDAPLKGSLSPDTFSIGPTSFTFTVLTANVNTAIGIILDPDLSTAQRNALRLHVCNTPFDLSTNLGSMSALVIPSGDINWNNGAVRNVHLSLPANNAAAGTAPTISGTAEVGQELTVDASGITDANGLPGTDTFIYQWYRQNEDGSGRELIADATAATYRLVRADAGKRVVVEVSFTDLLGGMEVMGSDPYPASGTVVNVLLASIRAVESKAMKDLLPARFEVSLSEAAATDLTVNLEFSRTNTNTPIILTSINQFVTIPAGQTSAEGDFGVQHTGDVTLTATIGPGEGYASAPAPENAAMVEVVGQSALTVSWAEGDYTVEEGEDASPVLQFTLPTGFPMPRGSVKVSVGTAADTAIIISDYPSYSRTPSLPAANWNDDDNDTAYTGLLTLEVGTAEDTDHEPEERFFLDLTNAPGTSPNIVCDPAQRDGNACRTTITITDDDPNTPPTSEDGEVTADEDTAYSFAVADFSFMDEDTVHSDTFQGVTVATLPAADKGVLQLDGVDVTTGQQIALAALEASPGLFTYTPPADENGDDFASFTFRVNDGTDDSENAYTMTIDVTAVADAPRVANPIPDRSAAVDVAFSYQVPANAFEDGDGDTLTYTATQDDDSALPSWLTFTAATMFTGTPMTSDLGEITVKVTASDGDSATTDASDEFVLTVREVPNTLPTAENSTVTATEDAAYTFTATNFSFTDADDDSLESVRITSLETAGDLQLDGADVTANQVITKTDIDANKLTFMAAANANGTAYATFGFTVSDGADESAAPYTMTIDVTPVNDPPTVGNPIPDQTATQGSEPPFSFTLPDDAFEDIDGDTLTYTATLANANNDPLPDWLSLDPATGVFTGTPATAGTLTVRVTASDPSGTSSPPNDFDIVVEAAPVFADTMVTRSVAENAAADTNVGTPIPPATDADSDGLTYTLEGDDAAAFDFDAATRQITTKAGVNYDFEAQPSYEVIVKAEDGKGGVGRVTVTINLTDVDEPPAAPAAPTVTATPNTATSLEVTWTAPPNDGKPPITSYHLRTCAGAAADCTADEDFTDGPTVQTGTSAAITGLMEDTLYQVQVRASNEEGDSNWSASGSGSTASAASITPADTTAPTVAIMNVPATSSAPFTATITFSEVVSGFMVDEVTAVNATLSDFNEATTGMVWTVLVTPTSDGEVTLTIAADVATDAAGNGNTAAPQASSTYSAPVNDEPSSMMPDTDTTAPTTAPATAPRLTSITRQAPTTSPSNADSLTWRVTFSEAVMNVDNPDFTVSGSTATVTGVQAVGGETGVYDVTVSGGDLASFNGTVTLGFAGGQNIQDENGNALAITTPTGTNNNSYMVDNAAPLVTITDVPETSTAPFTATITFNEVVSGFMVDDVTAVNATLSDFSEATPGTVWTVLVTPAADGLVTLDIGVDVATDAAGNGNTAALQARSTYSAPDRTAPLVTITDVPETSTAPFTATITFNEVVSDFTMDDITVVNATLSDFSEATPGTVWIVLVTPAADGLVTLDIAAGVATDAAGNGNTAALQARSTYSAPAMETEAQQEAKAVLDEVVLPNLVQQLTAETTEVITSRLNTIASGSPSTPLTLSLEDVVADTVAAFHGERERLKNGSFEWRQALSGRDFVLPLSGLNLAQGDGASAQDNPFSTLAVWGGGNYASYRNIIDGTDVDGDGFSGVIGIDMKPIPQLVTGLALTTSRWGMDYATDATDGSAEEGTYEIGVTMVNPYLNWLATEQLSLWATVGYGRGEVEQDPEEGDGATRTDGLTSWAGGLRFQVIPGADPLTGEGSPFGLAFKVDGATSSFLDTSVQLARLAAEISHSFAVENGLLSAALELGWSIRSVSDQEDPDGQQQAVADQNDGGGAELASSLNWRNVDGSLSATVDTRVLLGGGHHREWGIGGYLRLTPSRRNGEGLSLTLQPSFGVTGTRLDELWSLSGNSDLAINNDHPGARLDAELAFGFPLGNKALLTPYTELVWEDAASTYGAGLRYGLPLSSLELDLKGARRNRANGNTEHRLLLDVRSDL